MLPHLAGQARSLGMALLGEPVSAAQAAEWGMIWKAVPDEAFPAAVDALAAKLAAAPTAGVLATRAAIRGAWDRSLDAQLDIERDGQRQLGRTEDYREGVRAFKDKRPPLFKGR
jgi:2-(1,2-epoxy-1,2-dihydrophenyl)acetyl-CoA isomerase